MEYFSKIHFKNNDFFVLRDDLINGDFNGNKARKLKYFLDANLREYSAILSEGSSQSNAMSAISILAKIKNLEFYYKPTHISSFLRDNPCANYEIALKNGMKIVDNFDFLKGVKTLFIPEGVACKEAEIGFKDQADLIRAFMKTQNEIFDIFLPSGTGTSAFFLAKNLPECNIFTTPCVGSVEYLQAQMNALGTAQNVRILKAFIKCYFADLKLEFYQIWKELKKQTGITFDLIYDPLGWLTLLNHDFERKVLYIHQGGLSGVESQLKRYERKFGVLA